MAWWRVAVWGVVALVGAVAVTLLGSNAWVHGSSHGRVHTVADAEAAPVVIVPGAGLAPGKRPSPLLAARLDTAAQLVNAGKASVILLSGDNRSTYHNEPRAMQQYLIEQGVAESRLVLDYAGFDTYDTCRRAREVFGVTDATIVSQGFHVPRAVAICRAQGINTQGVPDTKTKDYFADAWTRGYVREGAASLKAAVEVSVDRPPTYGGHETGVRDALQHVEVAAGSLPDVQG